MDVMRTIRTKAKTEELDYLFLMNCLASYKHPRDKLTALLRKEELIRVKKGLYVFGKDYRQRPFSYEVLANLIYGPSYISFEYALGYYGLIPEKVSRITSTCLKRNKCLKTPIGEFVYHYLNPQKFPVGITLESIDDNTHFFIASREKALADYMARQMPFDNREDLLTYLIEGIRISANDIDALKPDLMVQIASVYQSKNVDLLCKILQR